MSERYKLHNVRLDDEVWAAVKAMECSLNQYLRTALLDHPLTAGSMIKLAAPAERTDPRPIPGVSVGLPAKKEIAGYSCRCVHSGCRGSKFTGTSKFQNLCPECREKGHTGEPRNCSACADDSTSGAL